MSVPAISRPIPISPQSITLAQLAHEAFERRALDELGYPPRRWDALRVEEQRLRCEAMQELINDGRVLAMPECQHPEWARNLVRREMVICDLCGLPESMLRRIARSTS